MKYKNINSAIHNFGYSFTSSMNYVDGGHVMDDIGAIRDTGHDIIVDWLEAKFYPDIELNSRIQKSLSYWMDGLEASLSSQNVELSRLTALRFIWPSKAGKYREATDDRGKQYKVFVRQTK